MIPLISSIPDISNIIDCPDENGSTPLVYALQKGTNGNEVAKFLLGAGARATTPLQQEDSLVGLTEPLIIASMKGSSEEVKSLILQRLSRSTFNLKTLIYNIFFNDDVESLKRTIEANLFDIHAQITFNMASSKQKPYKQNLTILEASVLINATKCLSYLLDHRKDLKFSDEEIIKTYTSLLIIRSIIMPQDIPATSDELDRKETLHRKMLLNTGTINPTSRIHFQMPDFQIKKHLKPDQISVLDLLMLKNSPIDHIRELLEQNISYNLNYTSRLISKSAVTVESGTYAYESPCTLSIKCYPPEYAALRILPLLVEHGANLDYIPENGSHSALFEAVLLGNIPLIKKCLELKAHPNINARDGSTILHALARCSSKNCVECFAQLFLDQGIDINQKNNAGCTALHLAVSNNNMPMIQFLLEYNCKIDICDNEGKLPIEYAQENNKSQIKTMFENRLSPVQKTQHRRPRKQAAIKPYPTIEEKTVVHSDTFTSADKIMLAIKSGSQESLQSLINSDTINCILDDEGNTPLLFAIKQRANPNCIEYLITNGASTTQSNRSQETAWTLALQDIKLLALLLRNNVDEMKNVDAKGNSIVHAAAINHKYEILEFIHKNYIDKIRRYIN